MVTKRPYPGTKSVLRAIALLKAFSDEQPERQLADLVRIAGLNKSTAFRLLTALESEGLITKDSGTGAYRLGVGMVALAGLALRTNELRSVCRPELEALAGQTQETASLEVLSEVEVMILDEVMGKHVMSGAQSVGTRWPAHATSTGKILLAALDDEVVRQRLPSQLAPCTPDTIVSLAGFLKELALTRIRGYAIAREELEPGLVAVAAPVRNYDGETLAAISLAGPTVRMVPEVVPQLGQLVLQAAGRVSAQLGFRAPS